MYTLLRGSVSGVASSFVITLCYSRRTTYVRVHRVYLVYPPAEQNLCFGFLTAALWLTVGGYVDFIFP